MDKKNIEKILILWYDVTHSVGDFVCCWRKKKFSFTSECVHSNVCHNLCYPTPFSSHSILLFCSFSFCRHCRDDDDADYGAMYAENKKYNLDIIFTPHTSSHAHYYESRVERMDE